MTTHDSKTPKRILLITNVDRGEANIFLATSAALLNAEPQVELHFATFPGLEESVASISGTACTSPPIAKEIVYHRINGLKMADGLEKCFRENHIPYEQGYLPLSFLAPFSFSTTLRAIADTIPFIVPYNGPDMAEIVSSIIDIIKSVDADLVVVDTLMTAALTACYHLGVKFTCLSPNAIKEFAAVGQPRGAGFWRYPALFSGYTFPVPLHFIPSNIFFNLCAAYAYTKDSHTNSVVKYLKSQLNITLHTPLSLVHRRPSGLKILVSTLPELDFPSIKPEHVIPCGPIVQTTLAISESDPELEKWLACGSTIYINLGTLCQLTETRSLELAKALRIVFDRVKLQQKQMRLQVLWKLHKYGDYEVTTVGSKIHDVLGPEIDGDQIRIVKWVDANPISILETQHILCSVHHGGANSYNEAVLAGVPQVVLAQWIDCYDYAQRVQMLDIGRIGNMTSKPQWMADELSQQILEVAFGTESENMRKKARALASVCRENGSGADNAAKILLGECGSDS